MDRRDDGAGAGRVSDADMPAFLRKRETTWCSKIETPCPSCGRTTLFIGTGGHLTCSAIECPNPSVGQVVAELKGKAEACTHDHELADRALTNAATGQVDDLVEELNRRVALHNATVRAKITAAMQRGDA